MRAAAKHRFEPLEYVILLVRESREIAGIGISVSLHVGMPCIIVTPLHIQCEILIRKENGTQMDKLAAYLLEHIDLDFSGIDLEIIQKMLREDRSPVSTQLMTKLIEEKGEEDLLIVLADCLKEFITKGIDNETVKKQLVLYAEA